MVNIIVNAQAALSAALAPVEIVERKGIGHPDTICDALAEELSLALCRYYRDRFGLILHHNVDKALLWGGASRTEFNGGQVLAPMEIFLAGRATVTFKGVTVPVQELLMETSRHWLNKNLHALDADQHVKLHTMIRPGSADLVDLYLRQQKTGVALANDTSCGVGYAPLDNLEQLVYSVERYLNSETVKADHPEIGEDIKVMGVRNGDRIHLTVACAFIDRHISTMEDYISKKAQVEEIVSQHSAKLCTSPVAVKVNTADRDTKDSIYLTVTGTSAEAGDDGEVGRGNRVNGLITPYRPMNMEAAAGKNPVTHVGKLYNIVAQRIVKSIVQELPEVQEAQCYLVSRIGHPISEPQVVDLKVQLQERITVQQVRSRIREITQEHLRHMENIREQLLEGAIMVY